MTESVVLATRHSPLVTLRKYAAIVVIDWQNELAYRANSLIWIAWSIFPSVTMMLVWLAAYGERKTVRGMTLPEMISYYFFVTSLSIAITPNHEWETAGQIREGQVTQYLIKPVDFFWFKAMTETAYQAMKTMMALPGLLLVAWLFRDYMRWPHLSLVGWISLFIACALTYGILMCFKSALSYLAFWFGEVGGVLEAWNIVMMVFAGRLIPVALLPSWFQAIGNALPFKWIYPFPISIAQGHVPDSQIAHGLLMQTLWLVVLYGVMRLAWIRGVRAYEGYGG